MKTETKPILFLDFDGTVSERDAIDAILERFADEKWQDIEERWKKGAIGSRECLREQVALVTATADEINDLLDEIRLDAGFETLLKTCQQFEIKPHIISDGFDFCIRRILSNSLITENLPVFSSHLEFQNGEWQTAFPYFPENCQHGCATCKPRVMKNLNPQQHAPTIFVGDGLSDRYAAQTADLVFAKKGLANFCTEKHIKFSAYQNLFEVAERIEKLAGLKASAARSAMSWLEFIKTQEIFN